MNSNQTLRHALGDNPGRSRKHYKAAQISTNGFSDLGIARNLMSAVSRLNFEHPTPVQKECIPIANEGRDIIGIAQTGSGKTLAYGIPMLQQLFANKRGTGLVLVPTRELALQVEEQLQVLSQPLNIRSVVLIGGASITAQLGILRKNPRVVIATPGRLMDLIEKRAVDLRNIDVFILDEADRMLDMGFLPDIKRIMKSVPDERQTMLFSATMPKEIEAIAARIMHDPTRVEVDRSGVTPAEVSHEMFIIKNQDKGRLLAFQLQHCSGPVLVFTRTKWMARKLTSKVNNMGFTSAQIHSNRSQEQRRKALEGFKRGKFQILIATDIAARGIDVSGIEMVVNYDMPANSEDYVHRIGRTGRAGKTGHAVSFATSAQEGMIKDLEKFMKTRLAVSALPDLPPEKRLHEDSGQRYGRAGRSGDERPSRRQFSKDRSPKRFDGNPGDDRKSRGKHPGSKNRAAADQDSKRPASPSKSSKSKGSDKKKPKEESPFWANFKKHRPAKKKSVGQGGRRKNRPRRG